MLTDIKGVGEKTLQVLHKLNIFNEKDLINNLPKSYIDLSNVSPLECAVDGSFCLVDLEIIEKKQPFSRGKLKIFKASAKSGETHINLIWYNQNYVSKKLEEGKIYTFYGKLRIRDFCFEFNNPLFEEKNGISKFQGIQPIYYTKGLINQKTYWNIVKETLKIYSISSIIPSFLEAKHNLMSLDEAFKSAHEPQNASINKGKDRIVLESLVRRMAGFRLAKAQANTLQKYKFNEKFDLKDYDNILPFFLNNSQINALKNLSEIMLSNKNLNAILCGDVGSGKTIIAMLLALFTKKNGYQSAIIAPTEILARQHYNTLLKLTERLNVQLAYLSSDTKAQEKREVLKKLASGEIDIIVGTHSLLSDKVSFCKLAFVVIDEQHRFGVAQRTCLIDKGQNAAVLTLSATPIPRSLQLIAYGDIDYFTIERRFENRTQTSIVSPQKRMDMWKYLYDECINKNGQAFIVAPQIVDSEGIERESVEELYKELKKIFPHDKIISLHGKMNAEEKQRNIELFAENKIRVLIATTVVEVGIDVPNANFMVIMDAENFGLAALHQLRGRVGRGGEKAYCFLYTAKENDEGLMMLTKTSNGYEIAEKDFDIRGAGDILGLSQSGTGSLQGITIKNLALAKEIVDKLDLNALKVELKGEITEFSLCDVSIT